MQAQFQVEQIGRLNRIYSMGRTIRVSVAHQQVINQTVNFAGHVPSRIRLLTAGAFVRGFRSALRMSQEQLSRRCGVPRAHITRLEGGSVDAQLSTLGRIFDALFCDLLILPLPRRRPGDVLSDRRLERDADSQTSDRRIWD